MRGLVTRLLVLAIGLCSVACARGCSSRDNGEPPRAASSAETRGRLIILGFDGVEPRWLEKWAAEAKLPHLKKLMDARGGNGYRHLGSTNPPQSPVAWTSFATGTHPGAHGIYDFIRIKHNREPAGPPVLPDVGTTSFEPQPVGPPVARNLRSGEPFWQRLGNQDVRVVALNVPYSFPPDPMRTGRMLSGLGVPDLRGINSTFTYVGTDVTDEDVARPPGGGFMVKLAMNDDRAEFELEGPSIAGENRRMSVPVEVEPEATAIKLRVHGREQRLPLGQWGDFTELTFEHEGQRVKGIARFVALGAAPEVRLFVGPISFDPREPYSPISYNNAFAGALAGLLGHLYKTVGWDHDTNALNAEVIDDAVFLADLESIERDRRDMLLKSFDANDWDMLIWVSTATDRVAHMFYRLMDPDHPRYDAVLAARHGDAIEREYRRMDETVGHIGRRLRPADTLLILSDHGFHNYRRGVHLNQWLRSNGFLALRGGATSGEGKMLLDVDWSATKAYAIGTGQVLLNRRGRERDGIVSDQDASLLLAQIRDGLLALRDLERGNGAPITRVYLGSDVYQGARSREAPDLQIAFAENYRTSWETITGGVPPGLFKDNDKKWSGDHAASDVEKTPGILISNRPLREDVEIVDLAPTALQYFGVERPSNYVGEDVFAPSGP